jgi:hypothetical protein
LNSEYLSLEGSPLRFSTQHEELVAEYAMQKYREVWAITSTPPYLAIDEPVLRAKMASVKSFVVFSAAQLFQNLSRRDLSTRLLAAFMGPGTVASSSPTADTLVEGEANPQAQTILRWNGLLQIGTHPFAALSTHYLAVVPGRIFQRKVGELAIVDEGKRSQPRCDGFDFDELGRLTQQFHVARFSPNSSDDGALYADMLDAIFEQNLAAHSFANAHHAASTSNGPKYNYRPNELTRYGRLVHTAEGEPRIETSFALLHYEKALYEYDSLKRASSAQDMERRYMHGVYCVVAIASCLEAVANRLTFEADGLYPTGSQSGDAVGRINYAARKLAIARGESFSSLGGKRPEAIAMEQIRVLRNSFVHANEAGAPVDPAMLTSAQMAQVSESACRSFLENLRLTVAFVFDQLPWIGRPLVTATNVRWLGDIEVP